MNTWFRFYAEALNDAKVQRLSPDLFKAWVNILCMACNGDGNVTGNISDIAFALRVTEETAGQYVDDLVHAGLIDDMDDYIKPHNWDERQFKSDSSKERVAAFRARKSLEKTQKQENSEALNRGIKLNGDGIKPCNVTGNRSVTPQDTDTDTDTEKNKRDNAAKASSKRGSRIPDHWIPEQAEIIFAKKLLDGWPRVAVEIDKFRDYWISQPGQKGVKLDWAATWRNWIRRAAENKSSQNGRPRHGGKSVQEIANQLLAEIEDEENEQISSSPGNLYSIARISDNR